MASISLKNSLFHVVVRDETRLIGMARAVGDGAMYFYIQDVVVVPKYQQQGIGAILMNHIEDYLQSITKTGSTVGLLSAKGKESFYARYNYIERPNDSLGKGMCKFI